MSRAGLCTFLFCCSLLAGSVSVMADSRDTINTESRDALQRLAEHAPAAANLVEQAAGVLVFPDLVKVGFGEGSQYGEGVLLVAGEPVGYFATAGAPFGLALGSSYKSQVILFMTEAEVALFRNSHGWEAGVDRGVLLLDAETVGDEHGGQPVLAIIFTDKGVTGSLTLNGGKITPIAR